MTNKIITADSLKDKAKELQDFVVGLRRVIHQHPELGMREFKTAALVAKTLREAGLEVHEGVNGTGVVGILKGSSDGKTIALRADMDALPLTEENDLPFKSQNAGVMHACGHDAHTAILLGVAKLLAGYRDCFSGNVKFIFQPCEEKPPGGAKGMIEAGVLEEPQVDAVVGLHVNPYIPCGAVGLKEGTVMAAVDMFEITVKGKSGHGAAPHQAVDAVVAASYIVQVLQTLASRLVDPIEPIVVTIGKIEGGYADNVIADRVKLMGTVRTLNSDLRKEVPGVMERLVRGAALAFGAQFEMKYEHSYPPVINDGKLLKLAEEACREMVGETNITTIKQPSMGGEDFAYFAQKVPGFFYHLGVKKVGKPSHPWHHPSFDIDEGALEVGVATMTNIALRFLVDC